MEEVDGREDELCAAEVDGRRDPEVRESRGRYSRPVTDSAQPAGEVACKTGVARLREHCGPVWGQRDKRIYPQYTPPEVGYTEQLSLVSSCLSGGLSGIASGGHPRAQVHPHGRVAIRDLCQRTARAGTNTHISARDAAMAKDTSDTKIHCRQLHHRALRTP